MPSPDGRREKLVRHASLDFLRGEQIFNDGRHLIDHRSAVRRFACKQADLVSDGVSDLGAGEPRKIVERNRIGGSFLDLELQVDRSRLSTV